MHKHPMHAMVSKKWPVPRRIAAGASNRRDRGEFWVSLLEESEKRNKGTLWFAPNAHDIHNQPKEWGRVSPISAGLLDTALGEYLKKDWLQHNLVEWAAINALLFDQVAQTAEWIKSGHAIHQWNWAYLIAGNQQLKFLSWTLVLHAIAFATRWIIPPALVLGLLVTEHLDAAGAVGGAWSLYLLYHVITWPTRRNHRKELGKDLERYHTAFDAMSHSWLYSCHEVINPTRLKELVLEADRKGAPLPGAIHALLDRAIQRDPAVFIRTGRPQGRYIGHYRDDAR